MYMPVSTTIFGLGLKILLGGLVYVFVLWLLGDVWVSRARLVIMANMARP
jgi:hypothetical protein